MMAKIINVDMLSMKSGVLTHQCNCMGKMGAGIALDIRRKFPLAYKKYMNAYDMNQLKLGTIQLIEVDDNLFICNLMGQYKYGRTELYTNYDAVRVGLRKLAVWSRERVIPVYINYKMGCNLAGGDWDVVYQIINEEIPEAIICKWDKK